MIDSSGYRKNVGIILVNSSSELLICKRFKEQSLSEKQNIYEDIDHALKKAPEEEK